VSGAQAMVHFTDANDILQTLNLSDDLKQALQAFVVSLSLQIGDNAKMAREGHAMHALQVPFRKADVVGASSNTDNVTCGLILHYLVRCKYFTDFLYVIDSS
jgi:mediator of RNA polymerase II transcription subunit 5